MASPYRFKKIFNQISVRGGHTGRRIVNTTHKFCPKLGRVLKFKGELDSTIECLLALSCLPKSFITGGTSPLQKLRIKMRVLLKDCGDVCELQADKQNVIGKAFYNVIKKDFQCCKLFASPASILYSLFKTPPKEVGTQMLMSFEKFSI